MVTFQQATPERTGESRGDRGPSKTGIDSEVRGRQRVEPGIGQTARTPILKYRTLLDFV
jgi:hypothetical protein